MGINIYRTIMLGDFIKIDSEIFDLLYPFAVETTEISIEKKDLQKLIRQEKNEERKEILKHILKQFKKDDVCDFTMS
jgi:hypothetical protein